MNEKPNRRDITEIPIEKPAYALPAIFCPRKLAEMPTLRQKRERHRALFYRRQSGNSTPPVYGFHITSETGENENPGSKH